MLLSLINHFISRRFNHLQCSCCHKCTIGVVCVKSTHVYPSMRFVMIRHVITFCHFLNNLAECTSTSGNAKLNDVHFINLSLVSELQVKKEVTAVPEVPQSLNLHRVSRARFESHTQLTFGLVSVDHQGEEPCGRKET